VQSKTEPFNDRREPLVFRLTRWEILLIVVGLLAQIGLFGCGSEPAVPKGISYLAMGDSCTVGESVEADDAFPSQLVSRLRQNGLILEDSVVVAKTGWTTDELLAGIDSAEAVNTRTFDFVTLLIGANNQFRGQSFVRYQREFVGLLNRSIELAGGNKKRVFVISIPDYSVTPFGQEMANPASVSAEIARFNQTARQAAQERDVTFIDITEISRMVSEAPDLLASDGLHPSRKQYSMWVDLMLSEIEPSLNRNESR
jgi:lysophospholipase L1-like esterase